LQAGYYYNSKRPAGTAHGSVRAGYGQAARRHGPCVSALFCKLPIRDVGRAAVNRMGYSKHAER